MGMRRVLKSPSRQLFSRYAGAPRFGGEISEFDVPRGGFPGPLKNFCGSGSFEGSALCVFKDSNPHRAVILRVSAICGYC